MKRRQRNPIEFVNLSRVHVHAMANESLDRETNLLTRAYESLLALPDTGFGGFTAGESLLARLHDLTAETRRRQFRLNETRAHA